MNNQNGHKQIPVAGREPKPEFTPVMMFDGVSCYACKIGAQAEIPIVCRTPSELILKARNTHDEQNKLKLSVCKNTRLVIEYSTALIETAYLDQLADESLIITQ